MCLCRDNTTNDAWESFDEDLPPSPVILAHNHIVTARKQSSTNTDDYDNDDDMGSQVDLFEEEISNDIIDAAESSDSDIFVNSTGPVSKRRLNVEVIDLCSPPPPKKAPQSVGAVTSKVAFVGAGARMPALPSRSPLHPHESGGSGDDSLTTSPLKYMVSIGQSTDGFDYQGQFQRLANLDGDGGNAGGRHDNFNSSQGSQPLFGAVRRTKKFAVGGVSSVARSGKTAWKPRGAAGGAQRPSRGAFRGGGRRVAAEPATRASSAVSYNHYEGNSATMAAMVDGQALPLWEAHGYAAMGAFNDHDAYS